MAPPRARRPEGLELIGALRRLLGQDEIAVRAAGGVLTRTRDDGTLEVLLIHRPKYDDWSFPKGKLTEGESWEQAALREVEEETGFRGELGRELATTRYTVAKGPKAVRYWEMRIVSGEFAPHDEVDEIRWLTIAQAAKTLTWDRDQDVIRSLSEPEGQ